MVEKFKFNGWKKIIYYLGFFHFINLFYWLIVAIYKKRYQDSPKNVLMKKLMYVTYYFGYITLGLICFFIYGEIFNL